VFRVTAAVLRAAQAQVRCGVCDADFNALRFLTDDLEAGATPSSGDDVAAGTPGPAPRREAEPENELTAAEASAAAPEPAAPAESQPELRLPPEAAGEAPHAAEAEFEPRPEAEFGHAPELEPVRAPEPEPEPVPAPEPGTEPGSVLVSVSEPEQEPGPAANPEPAVEAAEHVAAEDRPAAPPEPEPLPAESAADTIVPVVDEPVAEPPAAVDSEPEPVSAGSPAPQPHADPPHATRTTPSADEARAFAEMTASIEAMQARTDAPSGEYNVLEPDDVAELLLDSSQPDGGDNDEDRALEFNVPPADWERIFVDSDPATPGSALDLSLGPTAADPGDPDHETLLLEPEPAAPHDSAHPVLDELPSSEPDLVLRWIDSEAGVGEPPIPEAISEAVPEAIPESVPGAAEAPPEDEFDVELDLGAALAAAGIMVPAAVDDDDPLARTDEYALPDFSSALPELDAAPTADAAAGAAAHSDAATNGDIDVDVDLDGVLEVELEADLHADPADEAARRAEPAPSEHAAAFADHEAGEHIVLGGGEPEPPLISAEEFRPRAVRPAREPVSSGALAAVAMLVLVLAGQLVHHARESLVDTPIVGPPVAALYRAIGAPVEPRWNLAAYEVRQWGASSDSTPGTLRLRASIVNRANRAQPYPLLRVVLEDRYGGAITRREFRPAEYLPGHASPTAPLAAGARADADLRLVDPGSEVVGFELDVCLERQGALVCSTDPRSPGG
jgi:hypothetical protein